MEKGEKPSLWPESPPPGCEYDTILQWDASLCSDGGTALGTVEIRQTLGAVSPSKVTSASGPECEHARLYALCLPS